MTTALIPGSFDPIHLGHLDIVEAASPLFERVVVAAVGNPEKGANGLFDLAEREQLIADSIAHIPNAAAARWSGLVVDLATDVGAAVIVKGLRGVADFEYEVQMAHTNNRLTGVTTMFLPTAPQWGFLASRFVREISKMGGSVSDMVPPPVAKALSDLFPRSAS